MKRLLAFGVALIWFAAPAFAETVDATGTGYGKSNNTIMPVSQSLMIIQASTDYERFDTAEGNPMAGFNGPCFGSIMVNSGAVTGGGSCYYTDADGEVAIVRWNADGMSADGRTQGSWSVIGGTGKWLGASGGGRFDAGENEATGYTNNVTGEIKFR